MGYSDAEVQAEIAKATAPLLAQIAEFSASAQSNQVEALVAQTKAESAAAMEELRTQLDAAVLEREAAKEELAAYKAEVEQAIADEEAKAELAALREERVTKVQEVASFPEKYVEANADRWALMDQENFETLLEEYKQLSGSQTGKIPSKTALVASREVGGETDPDGIELFGQLMRAGIVDAKYSARTI